MPIAPHKQTMDDILSLMTRRIGVDSPKEVHLEVAVDERSELTVRASGPQSPYRKYRGPTWSVANFRASLFDFLQPKRD